MNLWQEYKHGLELVANQQARIVRLNILIREADRIFESLEPIYSPGAQDAEIEKWQARVKKEIAE